ncbi:hypothetical protein LZ30DRAFT_328296 [Colletotrichum cereale]|nr:hypothetical protein LZ30DRAFT_328296 [Colletotrichum cereale]
MASFLGSWTTVCRNRECPSVSLICRLPTIDCAAFGQILDTPALFGLKREAMSQYSPKYTYDAHWKPGRACKGSSDGHFGPFVPIAHVRPTFSKPPPRDAAPLRLITWTTRFIASHRLCPSQGDAVMGPKSALVLVIWCRVASSPFSELLIVPRTDGYSSSQSVHARHP